MVTNKPLDWVSSDGSTQHLDKLPASAGFAYYQGDGVFGTKDIPKTEIPDNYDIVWQGSIEFTLSRTGSYSPINLDAVTGVPGLTNRLLESKHSLIGIALNNSTYPYYFLENERAGSFAGFNIDAMWSKVIGYPLGDYITEIKVIQAVLSESSSAYQRVFGITAGYNYLFKAASKTFDAYFQDEKAYLKSIAIIRD